MSEIPNWETDRRDIGECLGAWENLHGISEEEAAMELRLTKPTYRRIKFEQHLVSEMWLRRMMCLIDKVGIEDASAAAERWLADNPDFALRSPKIHPERAPE